MILPARNQPNEPQRGAVLVLFALLVFGLMAMAALVIDMGMASATQGQMQSAVDSAALEAMRGRNTTDRGEPDYHEPIVLNSEGPRRDRAAELIRLIFDDDLDPDNGDLLGIGVGPDFRMTGGIGEADASALIELGGTVELDSAPLQPNSDWVAGYNSPTGDMVGGRYISAASHIEPADYNRDDFIPAPSLTTSSNSDAFLVRMRRTGEDSVPGASWVGPAIPYLFGRGSLIGASDSYSPRKDGISVRATAIVGLQHALQVGRGRPKLPGERWHTRGVLPFAIRRTHWNRPDIAINDPRCVELLETGEIRIDPGGVDLEIGFFINEVTAIGQEVVPAARPDDVSALPLPYEGWVPIYEDVFGTNRVIGFGYVDLETPESMFCTGADVLQISKRASVAASHNASPTFPSHTEDLSKAEWELIFALLKGRPDQTPPVLPLTEPLLAPAISR